MTEYKVGERLRSRVSKVQMIVVRADDIDGEILCDGVAFARAEETLDAKETADSSGPVVEMGKRYEDAAGSIELLCVSGGVGVLSIGDRALTLKAPKPLPASD